ncbi:MAG: DNA polymerase III subunit delta [Candidatus Brocadiia bacterium]|nr:DNA polymerase III subunit delta [Candidatus Brocadiia bacterium]
MIESGCVGGERPGVWDEHEGDSSDMPTIHAIRFEAHLSAAAKDSGAGLKPVYAFTGPDEALKSTCVATLRAAVESSDMPGSMVRDIEGEASAGAVFDELRTQPFMGMQGLRAVVVRNGDKFVQAHADALKDYLGSPSATGVLALCCGKLDARTELGKAIGSVGVVVDCRPPSWNDARAWIGEEAARHGKRLTPPAAQALLDAAGPNITALGQEIEKLSLHAGQADTISERDVEELVPESRSRSIFDLSDAMARHDPAPALRLVRGLLLRGDRPERIVGFLAGQTRRLWQIKGLLREGMNGKEIQQALGMRDFAVRKAVPRVQLLSDRWFAERVALLCAADTELKTTSLPARHHLVWLTRLLAALCA